MGWSSQAAKEAAKEVPSSYAPVDIKEPFANIMARMKAEKPKIMERQQELLKMRYDLDNHPAPGVTMTRGKAVQEGVRVKLVSGLTWENLGAMSPEEIKAKGLWPAGFLPLPHPNHKEGGMVFPKFMIEEMKKQEAGT
jgi:cytochrome c peroxidase